MFFTVEEAQAAQAKEEKLKWHKSLQININTDRLMHHRELYSSPMLNNFLKENQTNTNEQTNRNNKKDSKQRKRKRKL